MNWIRKNKLKEVSKRLNKNFFNFFIEGDIISLGYYDELKRRHKINGVCLRKKKDKIRIKNYKNDFVFFFTIYNKSIFSIKKIK